MAIEAKRGCGYRKVGGIYLVASSAGIACDRLPHIVDVCPTCSAGIKQARGWTWVDVAALFGGPHRDCKDAALLPGTFAIVSCPLCGKPSDIGRAGLLWIGEKFYASPNEFLFEAQTLGISRRIAAVPRNFVLGSTWVLLAHSKAVIKFRSPEGLLLTAAETMAERKLLGDDTEYESVWLPAIFSLFKPERIEKIVTRTQSQDQDLLAQLRAKGVTPVIVPDDDRDHTGAELEEEQAELFEDLSQRMPVQSEAGSRQPASQVQY